jgi:uncharacterized membrane protein YgaE (UPF0421/DUF939 family)
MTGVLITVGVMSTGVGAFLLNERRHRDAYRRKVAQMEAQAAERMRQVRAVRAELERVDCLEASFALPARIPSHEAER